MLFRPLAPRHSVHPIPPRWRDRNLWACRASDRSRLVEEEVVDAKSENGLAVVMGVRVSAREVAVNRGLARSTVGEYWGSAKEASLSWPLVVVDDARLENLLFPRLPRVPATERPLSEWNLVDKVLRGKDFNGGCCCARRTALHIQTESGTARSTPACQRGAVCRGVDAAEAAGW